MFPPLKSIVCYCRLWAFWPHIGPVSLKSVDVYYRLVVFLITCLSTASFITWTLQLQNSPMHILFITRLISSFISLQLNVATLVMGFLNKGKMERVMETFVSVDQELLRFGSQPDLKEAYMFQGMIITLAFAMHLPSCYSYWFLFDSKYQVFEYFITMGQIGCTVIMYTCVAHATRSRYRRINTQMSSLLQDLATVRSSVILSRLRQLTRIHIKLRGIAQEVASAFSLQMFLQLALIVLGISTSLLVLLQNIQSGTTMSNDNATSAYNIMKYAVLLVLLAEQCNAASSEGNETVLLVHELHQKGTSDSILDEILEFSLGIYGNPVKFTVGGFLVIDRGLLIKLCVVITTYLVITLQIEDVTESETTTSLMMNTTESVWPLGY